MLEEAPLAGGILSAVRARYPGLDPVRTGHELIRRQITAMVEDVIAETQRRLAALDPRSPEEVRGAGRAVVAFSATMEEAEKGLKAFLYARLYRHPQVMEIRRRAETIVTDLFDRYFADPSAMGENWREGADLADEGARARRVADYIAGMTDTYAVREHRRLFDHTPELV